MSSSLTNNLNHINYCQYITEVTNTESKINNNDNNDNNLHSNSLLDKCYGNNIVGTMNTTKKSQYQQLFNDLDYVDHSEQSSEPKTKYCKKRFKISPICNIL